MSGLRGKTALVTGASRGLGEACVRALAAQGANVVLAARSTEKIDAVCRDIVAKGGQAMSCVSDVSDFADLERCIQAAQARFGRIDMLVNNAGVIEPIAHIADADPQAWARSIAINLSGAFNAIRAVLPGMIAAGGGRIVNISSGAARRPLEGWSAYCAGKAGLAMLTQSLHMETAAQGVRCFGLSPGTIDTDMQGVIRASGMNPVSRIPREELFPVAHAVQAVVYLCSSASDDLAGKDVSVREEGFRRRVGL